MYTFKTFFVLTLASYVIAAPPADEPAECKPMKEKEEEISKCCKLEPVTVKEQAAFVDCMKLVKDTDKKGPPKPEGFECLDDCILSKTGSLGSDKKIDPAKINAAAKTTYTGDWAEPGAKMVEKCLAQVAENKDKTVCSTSGADVYTKCIFRESYINCPEKSWTNSDACKANKERVIKCPKTLPYNAEQHKAETR
uniref:Odorant-binding protein 20 n=1 Tax=Apolygus lucorum TaxID=248454 RepID=A0A142FH87_APOLU|nr:odorant-binding protein 20 [Apolygus lucorum]